MGENSGQPGFILSLKRISTVKKHRVLVIGVGSIGERHLRCFGSTDRAELAFSEINDELRGTIADRYGINATFGNLDEAVAWKPEIAVVCAPADVHVPMTTRLAEAGIHVLCEKPLSVSLDGVEPMMDTVARAGVTTAVAYVWRSYPESQAIKAAIDSGRFGKPLELVVMTGGDFAFNRPAYRNIYFKDHKTGGGAIQDAITHLINLGEWFAGPVDRLTTDAAHQALEGVVVEDTVHVLTRQGDCLGCYSLNLYQAPAETTVKIVCEKATLQVEFHNRRWMWQDKPDGQWHVEQNAPGERDDLYVFQAHNFLDAVEGKAKVLCTLEEGLQTLKVNLAGLASAEAHNWQTIECGPK